jgi:2-keto-4-pentenoate hydratase/2-oxohepta-3-ene-1,7-dioic acid hydratase in catechol pathway
VRLVTFRVQGDGDARFGALEGDETVVDLTATGSPLLARMLAYLDAGAVAREEAERALEQARATHRLADVTLLAPLLSPRSVRDCMVFEQHIVQATRTVARSKMGPFEPLSRPFLKLSKVWYEQPIYYKSNRFSVVGPDADVRMPAGTEKFDYELEWAVVIGRAGSDIAPERAREHIAGYTVFNDFSARDEQAKAMRSLLGPGKGKDFDGGNALGPWLVTQDELPAPYELEMEARVNGATWSSARTGDMRWSFEDVIAHVSRSETLRPGDVIGSGTAGLGCGLEHGAFLEPGDVVELEVERIGVLRNRVTAA